MYEVTSLNYNGNAVYSKKNNDTLALEHLLLSEDSYEDRVYAFENYLKQFQTLVLDVKQEYADGICSRTVVFPENMLATGEIHIKDHMDVMLEGEMLVATEDGFKHLVAPCTMITKAGTKKAGVALKRTVWVSYHPTDAKTVEELEAEIVFKGSLQQARDLLSYTELVKDLGMTQEEVDKQVKETSDLVDMPEGYDVEIKESGIHGLGCFSSSTVRKGELICPARLMGNRTPAGRYSNHSAEPNSEMRLNGSDVQMYAIRDIEAGEELTSCYRKTIEDLSCQQ